MNKIKKIFHLIIAVAAYWFYGRPARKMIVIGVTGTKGKSTTCRLIASALAAGGDKVGLLSTVEIQIADSVETNHRKLTMLGYGRIQSYLKKMFNAGCRYAVVETSSQGILQYRHYGLRYDALVFTNLAPEHVEAHGGYANYKKTKARIFRDLLKCSRKTLDGREIKKIILANVDDKEAGYFLAFAADKKITFALNNETADYQATVQTVAAGQTVFTMRGERYELSLTGDFNVYNALPAIILAKEYGVDSKQVARVLSGVRGLAGRMEWLAAGQDFNVVVDFAHETLSYKKLFSALRKITAPDRKIIVIVGSDGGGRDISKREPMGRVAGELADIVIVTDVNPFDEGPLLIINQVAMGARAAGKKEETDLFLIPDRRVAIARAFSLAVAGDTVALVGKGNEAEIIRAHGVKEPWSDMAVAREEIKKLQELKII